MSQYFCPLPQFGPVRPADAVTIAGGWTWFTQAEVIERGRPSQIIPASAVPEAVRALICAPRAPVAGVALDQPRIMGILNTTPDSFSDGGQFDEGTTALTWARTMAREGADIIDIGGESTRPGAEEVAVADEIARTEPVIAALAGQGPPISIDTRKSAVARAALDAGAAIVNDVSALRFDPAILALVAERDVPVCLMHSQGEPDTMQQDPRYENVLLDVYDHLAERIAHTVAAGVSRDRILVDPGIGFGKTLDHNLALLQRIGLFHGLGCAILLGASRKRFIGTLSDEPVARRRLAGSLAVALAGVAKGVQISRVHDVKETRQGVALWRAATGMGQD